MTYRELKEPGFLEPCGVLKSTDLGTYSTSKLILKYISSGGSVTSNWKRMLYKYILESNYLSGAEEAVLNDNTSLFP